MWTRYSILNGPSSARLSNSEYTAKSAIKRFRTATAAVAGKGSIDDDYVLVPDGGRQRVNADEVQVVGVDGRVTVDAAVRRPEHDLAGLRVDQPAVLVRLLVRQRGSDLVEIQVAYLKHRFTPDNTVAPLR
jgi:hypothetical protein